MDAHKIFDFCQKQVAKKCIFLPPEKADLFFLLKNWHYLICKEKLNLFVLVVSQENIQVKSYLEKK